MSFLSFPLQGGAKLGHATRWRNDHPDHASVRGHAGGGILGRSGRRRVARDADGGDGYHGAQQVHMGDDGEVGF